MGDRLISLRQEGPLLPLVILGWTLMVPWLAFVALAGTTIVLGAGFWLWEEAGWPSPPVAIRAGVHWTSASVVFAVALVREVRRSIRRSDEWLVDHGRGVLRSRDEIGALWLLERRDEGPRWVVEVLDATPRADGSRARYFLRVPPHVMTPREAVAWSFGLDDASAYRPVVET